MWDWVDVFSLAWLVPLILDAMMTVAMSVYEYFVGTGIIYMLIWGWLAFAIGLYLVKMYFPKPWLDLFGLSGGGEMWDSKTDGWSISKDVARPILRALFAIIILLQIRPQYITNFIVNPFLEFGAVYVGAITRTILPETPIPVECPEGLGGYLTASSCEFLVQPIHEISRVNNSIIQKGFEFLTLGGTGGILLNIITGLALIVTFFSSNLFMALLIIQGIFRLGLSLITYPFMVLVYVVKKQEGDAWLNPWPALKDLVDSLKKLVIAMIAVAFILLINISVAYALLGFNPNSVQGFGGHSITWMTAILMFWIMFKIFDETRTQLNKYTGGDMTELYNTTKAGVQTMANNAKTWGGKAIKALKGKK